MLHLGHAAGAMADWLRKLEALDIPDNAVPGLTVADKPTLEGQAAAASRRQSCPLLRWRAHGRLEKAADSAATGGCRQANRLYHYRTGNVIPIGPLGRRVFAAHSDARAVKHHLLQAKQLR